MPSAIIVKFPVKALDAAENRRGTRAGSDTEWAGRTGDDGSGQARENDLDCAGEAVEWVDGQVDCGARRALLDVNGI